MRYEVELPVSEQAKNKIKSLRICFTPIGRFHDMEEGVENYFMTDLMESLWTIDFIQIEKSYKSMKKNNEYSCVIKSRHKSRNDTPSDYVRDVDIYLELVNGSYAGIDYVRDMISDNSSILRKAVQELSKATYIYVADSGDDDD